MAVTRLGFGGPSAAYPAFQPKIQPTIIIDTTDVVGTYVLSEELIGTVNQ